MPRPTSSARLSRRIRRRRTTAALIVAILLGTATAVASNVGSGGDPVGIPATVPEPATDTSAVTVTAGGREVVRQRLRAGRAVDASRLRAALESRLPASVVAQRGRALINYEYAVDRTVRRAVALGPPGGTIEAVREARSSRIKAPVLRQAQANTCESAALAILLSAMGQPIAQGRLQNEFPVSGPKDPQGTGPTRIWGDPDEGYVGRPDGGGVAGGFGVYPRPVVATARRLDRRVSDLTGTPARRLYRRLLQGRPVMAWVGLDAGPYGQWQTSAGRTIKVNFNEHTIVLVGVAPDGRLRAVNPLQGTAELWSRQQFETAYALLGRRSIGP